jgi:hypothetical protein
MLQRRIDLPKEIDSNEVEATMNDGFPELILPKKTEAKNNNQHQVTLPLLPLFSLSQALFILRIGLCPAIS